jgi:hypothetical protein
VEKGNKLLIKQLEQGNNQKEIEKATTIKGIE